MAGGTGDIAFRIVEARRRRRRDVTVCDINADMLAVGARARREARARRRRHLRRGNAEACRSPTRSFDAYTIAFGIRNVPRIDLALAEAHRVLKPGGRFLCLEFSPVDVPGLDQLYDAYSFNVIPRIGRWSPATREAYHYLVEIDPQFPTRRPSPR